MEEVVSRLATWWSPVMMFRGFADNQVDNPELGLEKTVLDCGAGGRYPPLALFHQHGYDAFGITEESTSVLGKTTKTQKLQRIDSLPEGTVFAQGYTPRVVIKEGQVLAIEFLKRLEEEEYLHEKETVKEEMARQITELIDASRSEKGRQKS